MTQRMLLLLAALSPALAACSREPPPPCPRPAIVYGLDAAAYGDEQTGNPDDITHRVAVVGFSGGCAYTDERVELNYNLDIVATPGPGYTGGAVSVAYFIATRDPNGRIVDKQVFSAGLGTLEFGEPTLVQERLQQQIADVGAAGGSAWTIFFGLELPRDEALEQLRQVEENL